MPAQLAPVLAPIAAFGVLIALLVTALSTWLLEWAQGQVRGWPVVGGNLAGLLAGVEGGLLNLSRSITGVAIAWLGWAVALYVAAINQLIQAVQGVETAVVNGLKFQVDQVFGILALGFLPPIEREIPAWFKHIEDELKSLPNEPAFRSGGPLRSLLSWLSTIWAVLSKLGPFVRVVVLPVFLVLGALWGLVELVGRLTRMQVLIDGLTGFTHNLDLFRQQDERIITQLVGRVQLLQQQVGLLQVDLERERAARVALATGTQQALQASERLQEAHRLADKSQWSPLLTLTVLATLTAPLIDTLRKTAECDPCAQLDQVTPDFDERISALETFGEP